MVSLFSADSTLMRGLTRLADMMILNLLFLVTSIPVFTLGASLTALNFTAMRIGTGECLSVSADYFRSFQQNFRQASVIALVLAFLAVVLAAWDQVISALPLPGEATLALQAVWYVLAFNLVLTTLFVFPYLARFEGRSVDVLRNALMLAWRHLPSAVASLVVIAGAVGLTLFYPHATGYGLLWLLLGFSAIAVASGFLFTRIFQLYIPNTRPDSR